MTLFRRKAEPYSKRNALRRRRLTPESKLGSELISYHVRG